jgi:D-alanyl-D-alanine carboxypeptidase/D-alanyl-D-alanine-endopeptidase (penicillin-binding protein 4)
MPEASVSIRLRTVRALIPLAAALSACFQPGTGPQPVRSQRAALRWEIDSILALPETRTARWGILIVDPERGDTLYSHDAGKLFVPASNMKLVTSAVALETLGPDHVFETRILTDGTLRDGALGGDLLIEGRGDPSVSDNVLTDAMTVPHALADSLWEVGVRSVRGRVLAHGNAFSDANAGFGWEWEDLETSSGAFVDELLFNEGVSAVHVTAAATAGAPPTVRTAPARTFPRVRIEATTIVRGAGADSVAQLDLVKDTLRGDAVLRGTIPVGDSAEVDYTHPNPAAAYVAAVREALIDRGIRIGDSAMVDTARVDTLLTLHSPPLRVILPAFLKPSQNQIGEMLFKDVALQVTDSGRADVARRIVGERLVSWGASPDGFLIRDGSGLSRHDMLSPETIVRVLDAMRRGANFDVYYASLPVAGVDGTLEQRMRGTAAEGNVRGKTGTLSNVRSLSGYVTTAGGRLLLFSILCNNYLVPTAFVTRVQDSIAVHLAELRSLR